MNKHTLGTLQTVTTQYNTTCYSVLTPYTGPIVKHGIPEFRVLQ